MKINIQLKSFWATGAGKSGTSLDSIVLRDKDGLPYIPGRTFKGLLRDAYLECGYKNDKNIFGHKKGHTENLATGSLRFNSLRVKENRALLKKHLNLIYHTKTSTALDEDKQAVNQSLRKNEMTIPLLLEVELYYHNPKNKLDNDVEEIKNACKMLRLLGEKRHRGLGRCSISCSGNLDPTTKTSTKLNLTKGENTLLYRCTTQEPMILVSKDKTEQNVHSLDYIPGSKFRGIIAGSLFFNNKESKVLNDFIFNNNVQFEDAHLEIDTMRSLKLPFSYYKQSQNINFLNYHHLEPVDWEKKTKQNRNGYFVQNDNELICDNIKYGMHLKSTRDIKRRSSEEAGLFVYHYIEAGHTFIFSVKGNDKDKDKDNNKKNLEQINDILVSKQHFIGKSALAEYGGCIDIERISEEKNEIEKIETKYIYTESDLCFLNKYGEFTAEPTAEQLTGNSEAKIDWQKSQIRTRRYAPYNNHRKNRDPERLIIEKGSVFILKKAVEIEFSKKGCFQTEGYGKIIDGELFLKENEMQYQFPQVESNVVKVQNEITILESESNLVKYFKENQIIINNRKDVKDKAKENHKGFKQKKSSQWARVFNATTQALSIDKLNTMLFTSKDGERENSIFNGGSKTWEKDDEKKLKGIINDNQEIAIDLVRRIAKMNIKTD